MTRWGNKDFNSSCVSFLTKISRTERKRVQDYPPPSPNYTTGGLSKPSLLSDSGQQSSCFGPVVPPGGNWKEISQPMHRFWSIPQPHIQKTGYKLCSLNIPFYFSVNYDSETSKLSENFFSKKLLETLFCLRNF